MKKNIFKFLVLTLPFLLTFCSTKKNTLVTRTFHNTTAKYNVYYNGNESFKQGVKKATETHKDNYNNILQVFNDVDSKTNRTSISNYNKAIEKASKAIRKHSITVKPKKKKSKGIVYIKDNDFFNKKEYCKWIDDSYLLMGKSQFYKRDFYPAKQTFEYIIKEYKNEPIKYDAFLWLIRTYDEMEKYTKAQTLIDQIEGDRKFPNKKNTFFNLVYAEHLLKQKTYDKAIPKLESIFEEIINKKQKSRIAFILGQLYHEIEQNDKAALYYEKVIKMNPEYNMAFNAKINSALLFNADIIDSKELVKALEKMLKDDKNIDYQDQIYYALANIYLEEGDEEFAIEHYLISAQKSTINDNQKGLSFLSIANIYFKKPDYQNSQIFYDSTVMYLESSYLGYEAIANKANNLTELVYYLNIIYEEDSLQHIAKMPEDKRNAIIDKIIENIKLDEEKAKEEQELARINNQLYGNRNSSNNAAVSGGKWYFYNPNALSLGNSEFSKKWGRRKHEDNWRRKNKSTVSFDIADNNETTGSDSSSTGKALSNKSREFYIVNLPFTDSALKVSHMEISKALYNVGRVYKDMIIDYPKSIETYEELIEKYPDHENLVETYYKLFQLNKLINDTLSANKYKNLIITEFPKTNYALSLTNPEYFKELEAKENEIKIIYVETYRAFNNANYAEVIEKYNFVDTAYKNNKLLPKFMYLKAMSIGVLADTATLIAEMDTVINTYPNDEIASLAKDVIDILNKEKTSEEIKKEEEALIASAFEEEVTDSLVNYTYQPDARHFFIVIVETDKMEANKIKFNISNFNIDYYSFLDFKVSGLILTSKLEMITVKEYKGVQQAINYYESIINVGDIFKDISPDNYRYFIISADNYKTFYNDKSVANYMKFFKEKYNIPLDK